MSKNIEWGMVHGEGEVVAECDNCGAELIIRDDDRAETVKKRLDVYHEQTQPLIDYYEKAGVLKNVDGTKGLDEVFAEIVDVLEAE